MNLKRATFAAAAGGMALLVIVGALALVIFVGYLLAAKYFFGGGPPYAEILALTVLPLAIGAGATLLTRALGGGWLRALISASFALLLALNMVLEELETSSYSPGEQERSIASTLLLVSAISVFVATIRRADMPNSRMTIVVLLVVVFVSSGVVVAAVAPESAIKVSFSMVFAAWILLPALTGLAMPPHDDRRFSRD